MKVWVAVYYDYLSLGEENDKFLGVAGSKETAQSITAPNLTWIDSEDGTQSRAPLSRNEGYKVIEKLVVS